jgi:hypothetical protein
MRGAEDSLVDTDLGGLIEQRVARSGISRCAERNRRMSSLGVIPAEGRRIHPAPRGPGSK